MVTKDVGGKTVVVDDEDAELLRKVRWRISPGGYVYATVYLHRLIAKPDLDKQVDHRNRNKTDNRRSNLEVVTQAQNLARIDRAYTRGQQKSKRHSDSTSKFLGVSRRRGSSKWIAVIKRRQIGTFGSEEEAAKAYNAAAVEEFGATAYQNKV